MLRKSTGRYPITVLALFILTAALFTGCGNKEEAKVISEGDRVSLTYVGTLNDGTVFDSSRTDQPFSFVVGKGEVIPGFDKAVSGMTVGEEKTFTIPAAEAYGERNEQMMHKVPHSFFPEEMTPEEGMPLQLQDNQGNPFRATIAEVGEDSVTIDLNPPLAGEDLTFDIKVVDVETPETDSSAQAPAPTVEVE